MTTVLDYNEIKQELLFFLRNNDIFTTTQRGVTTAADTGTFSAASSYLINKTNVKNVRSVVVAAVTLSYGTDYTVDTNYNDGGTIKCKITFTAAQTGAYTITYDYGTDKIHPDFPRKDLSISSFPRVAIADIGESSEVAGLGALSNICSIKFSIYVYDLSQRDLDDYIKLIKTAFIQNKTTFYNLNYVDRIVMSPLMVFSEGGKRKILQRNIDYVAKFNIEEA